MCVGSPHSLVQAEGGGLAPFSTAPLEANAQLWSLWGGIGWMQIVGTAGIIELVSEATTRRPRFLFIKTRNERVALSLPLSLSLLDEDICGDKSRPLFPKPARATIPRAPSRRGSAR